MKDVVKCPKCKRRRISKGAERYRCRKCRHIWDPKSQRIK